MSHRHDFPQNVLHFGLTLFFVQSYACNFLDFTPADIIRNLYGHACGDADFGSLCVQGENNKFDWGSTGECQYGFKKQGYLFQAMWEEAEDVTQFRLFANVVSVEVYASTNIDIIVNQSQLTMCLIFSNHFIAERCNVRSSVSSVCLFTTRNRFMSY